MEPAFSTTRQAAAFAVLLLVLLLLPALINQSHLPPREEIYPATTWRFGPFNYIRRQIFEEKADIDIAFIGSSRMWSGINTPHVQAELSKHLGHEAVVLTLGWAWNGFDALYFITQDLLEHRKVKLIVFDDEFAWENIPHAAAPHWFRYGDNAEALKGLPLRIQTAYYFAAILGLPQNLAGMVRRNFARELISPENDHWQTFFRAQNSSETLGALITERGTDPKAPFVSFQPDGNARPENVLIFSEQTKTRFQFSGPATPPWQLHFAQKFAALAKTHGSRLVFLHLLPPGDKPDTATIQEREFWPEALQVEITMMGIPPADFFSGISGQERASLFYTLNHFNKNGQTFFTQLITPALLQIYDHEEGR